MLTVRLAVCVGRNWEFLSVLNVKRGRRETYLCTVFRKTREKRDTERNKQSLLLLFTHT